MAKYTRRPPSFDEFKARAVKQMADEGVQLSEEQLRSTYDCLYPNAETELSAQEPQESAKISISQESLTVIDRLNTLSGLVRALWILAGVGGGLLIGFPLGGFGIAVGLIVGCLVGYSLGSFASVSIDFCRRLIELLDKIASK